MVRTARMTMVRMLAYYVRHTPSDMGRWRLIPFVLREIRTLRPSRCQAVRTRHGFTMICDLEEWLGQHVYVTGDWEDSTSELVKWVVRPGDHIVDVGANAGFFTLLAAGAAGATGRVVAFEPVANVASLLTRNVTINGFRNVTIRNEAASNQTGQAEFYTGSPEHTGVASLRSRPGASACIRVTVAPLDDLIAPDYQPRLVKIDVEGAEYSVLQGMRGILERAHPDLIVEVSDRFLRESGRSAVDVLDFLRGLGYSCYHIEWNGLVPIGDNMAGLPDQFNAYFTRSAKRLPAHLLAGSKQSAA